MTLFNAGAVPCTRFGTIQNKKQFQNTGAAKEPPAAFAAMLASLQQSCQTGSGAGNICRLLEGYKTPGTPKSAQDYLLSALQASSRTGWYASLHDSAEDGGRESEEASLSSAALLPQAYLRSTQTTEQPGQLAARFESGNQGVNAVGYDKVGGTSYGTYQISSKAGTMSEFIAFLDRKAPAWARRLRAAGPADTGSVGGGMPREWRRIAAEDSAGFARLQQEFISQTHYQEALKQIAASSNVRVHQRSQALREVLWSTSVQHGPTGAAEIFDSALEKMPAREAAISDKKLIEQIYARRSRCFVSSSAQVRSAVRQRLRQEKMAALDMLRSEQINIKI